MCNVRFIAVGHQIIVVNSFFIAEGRHIIAVNGFLINEDSQIKRCNVHFIAEGPQINAVNGFFILEGAQIITEGRQIIVAYNLFIMYCALFMDAGVLFVLFDEKNILSCDYFNEFDGLFEVIRDIMELFHAFFEKWNTNLDAVLGEMAFIDQKSVVLEVRIEPSNTD